ncbi:hypothetical protein LEP1GSC125_3016 [Leptospira mayottensis 200901122]|uniref:Uncharacterized protein n=1 Tax=Leptospira mayottensis 200901122 TaxID=1193010 RepID=A0AA87MSE7_9LEPT|nr:hypothetical protein LEP1GSC125_3016 [Leptospira mayottensis 200901122]
MFVLKYFRTQRKYQLLPSVDRSVNRTIRNPKKERNYSYHLTVWKRGINSETKNPFY